jgi:UDP-2,3-diacylglucosamine pyrophosphatase LpxH
MNRETAIVPATNEYLTKLWKDAPEDVLSLKGTMQHGDEYKYVTVSFDPKEYPSGVEILHITDVQFGHLSCNVPIFREFRDWVLKEKNRFVLFGGDMVDAATVISVASPYENTEEPQGQVFRFVEEAMPMRHRVLGYVGGNHERRSVKTFGDLGHLIATFLRVPYSSGKQFIDVKYGEHQPFKISLWHGGSGSRTKGAKMQMLHRFMTQGDAQLYLVGHLHDAMMTFDWRERRKNGKISLEKFAGVMSSSFLEHYGTYAEVAGIAASGTMMWRVILEENGHWQLTAR